MNNEKILKQFLVTPAAGKRIIAKAFLQLPTIKEALINNTIVIIAGTTNGYIAEEILNSLNQSSEFVRKGFFRGITLPPNFNDLNPGKLDAKSSFEGDVIIEKGEWKKGKTIFDVSDDLKKGDIIIKGANVINIEKKQAGIYIGHPNGGTINKAMEAIVGRRVELYIPVGLEKRIPGDVNEIARKLNAPNASGPRMLSVVGNIITELEAIKMLTGSDVELVASGGVCGAEGSYWLAVSGTREMVEKAEALINLTKDELNFEL